VKYIEKKGVLGLETDMNSRAEGAGFASDLIGEWDLDVEALKHYSKKYFEGKPPKLVHNIIFSMPVGTSPKKVFGAVRKLALNEWALEHRYAMALHTDTPRPHVHVILKAVSEQGIRLNIKKATLRNWRAQFAENLRELGELANATERAVRGETRTHKRTAIYRAASRNDSTHIRRISEAARSRTVEPSRSGVGSAMVKRTRSYVVAAWRVVASNLNKVGDETAAADIYNFVDSMAPPRTEQELLAAAGHAWYRA
jgi:hypothetical protein